MIMMKHYRHIAFLILIISSSGYSQEFRNRFPADFITVSHPDNSLNLFDFGGNPAWLIRDEMDPWLRISPSFTNIGGSYKREYHSRSNDLYGVSFSGVKPLDAGTFKGFASYFYDYRHGVNGSLKYDPYAGEAFFSSDLNKGNITFKGPSVGFIYSFELLPSLFFGPTVNYKILNGLKDVYSKAVTIYRNLDAGIGTVYEFSKTIQLGAIINFGDSQEKITSKSDDLRQVEIFNYRGNTYAVTDRSNLVSQKIKKQALSFGPQLYISFSSYELAARGEYRTYGTRVFIPRGTMENVEEGNSEQTLLSFHLLTKYHFSEDFSVGSWMNFSKTESWSGNSARNLLLWDWENEIYTAGAGASYNINSTGLKAAFEFEYNLVNADSNKYIDHRYVDLHSDDFALRILTEYMISGNSFITASAGTGYVGTDVALGGKNTTTNSVSVGFCRLWNDLQAELFFVYNLRKPETGKSRQTFSSVFELKYFSF